MIHKVPHVDVEYIFELLFQTTIFHELDLSTVFHGPDTSATRHLGSLKVNLVLVRIVVRCKEITWLFNHGP